MDPGFVPEELQNLTFIEQMLIARVQPVMRVYRITTRGIPGQYFYKDNIINVGQDINEIAHLLPRIMSNLDVIVVRWNYLEQYRDFYVRKDKVLNALKFLKLNNPYYTDIEIDEQQISQLPINGSIYNMLKSIEVPDQAESPSDGDLEQVYESVIPNDIQLYEKEKIESAINNNIPWLQATNVINEFTCEGYVSMAFPSLFPLGKAELNDFTRPNNMKLTALEYFQFLMQYKDQRFAKYPRFRYFALNTIQ